MADTTTTSKTPSFVDMLQAGVHFGHKKSRWHPNMKPFVFGLRNNIYIINLEKTVEKMNEAATFAKELGKTGKVFLFVGTKKQANAILKEAAERAGLPFVALRWLGGTITNFDEIYKNLIKRYLELKSKLERGELAKYTKKEQLGFTEQIAKMEKKIGGISTLKKIPDALFIVDPRKETTALCEAKVMNVPVVALCDTDTNPKEITYPIPCNDDGISSLKMMVNFVTDAYLEGKAEREATTENPNTKVPMSNPA